MVQILAFEKRGDVPASSHLPQLYARPDEAEEVAAGLFSGHPFPHRDRCVYIGLANLGERIEGRLEALGVRVADLKAAGQFRAPDERSESPDRAGFDPSRLLADHLRLLDEARRKGFAGMRLVIELSWLADAPTSRASLLEYEALCDAVFSFQRQPIVVIAQYDAARLGERLAGDLVKLHPIDYIGRYLKHNPDYPPMGPGGAGPSVPNAPVASQPRPRGPRTGETAASA